MTYQQMIIFALLLFIPCSIQNLSASEQALDKNKQTRLKRAIDHSVEGIETTGNAFTLQQNYFKYDEINLSHGSLEFSETDLLLPGKNGLDLKISRQYNSKFYRSDPDPDISSNKHNWGGWIGHGWRFGFAMRAFLVRTSDKTKQSIIIDTNGQLETFNYIFTTGAFRSTSKRSLKKVSYKESYHPDYQTTLPSQITVMSNGQQLIFSQMAFVELHQYNHQSQFEILGFYLTRISDLYQNAISIEYASYGAEKKSVNAGGISHIIGHCYEWINNLQITQSLAFVYHTRPVKLVDTYNQTLSLTYQNTCGEGKNCDVMIGGIHFINTNGNQTDIKYNYDESGNLIHVQKGDLPGTSYEYQYYTPDFKWNIYKSNEQAHTIIYRHVYPNESFSGIIQEHDAEFFNGFLLNRIQTPLGSNILYKFHDCLVRGNPDTKHENNITHIYYPTFSHATFPVIVSKTIENNRGDKKTQTYYFKYPRDIRNHISKVGKYVPSNIKNASVYYFQEVQVDLPDALTDEWYQFNQGLPEIHMRGIYKEKTFWDFSTNQREEIHQFQCDQLQMIKVFHGYDQYNNLTGFSLYIDDQEYIRKTFTYWQDYSFLEKNLLHLIKTETIESVATEKKKTLHYLYTDKGKIQRISKLSNISVIPLESFIYFPNGQMKTRIQYTAGGQNIIHYEYSENEQYRQIIQNKNGKISITTYDPYTGLEVMTQDANHNKTRLIYDDYGRLISKEAPEQNKTLYHYSDDLRQISMITQNKCISKYYDEMGRLIRIDYPDGEEDIRFEYYYANKIKNIYKIGDKGQWLVKKQFQYDEYLRPTTIEQPEWGSQTYTYDDNNHHVIITDTQGRSTQKHFDVLNRLIDKTFVPEKITTRYIYDAFNHVTEIKDARQILHESDYDADGNLVSINHTRQTGDMPSIRSSSRYFPTGELQNNQQLDRKGDLFRQYAYDYDIEGRITQIYMNDISREQLTYDQKDHTNGQDHLTSAENDDCLTQFHYDKNGRVSHKRQTIKDIQKTYDFSQTYNGFQCLESITFHDKRQIQYKYDNLQRLSTIHFNGKKQVSIDYYPNNNIRSIQYANGCRISYTYERDILMKHMQVMNGDGKIIYHQSCSYDPGGNLTKIEQDDLFVPQMLQTRSYSYNTNNQIIAVQMNQEKNYYQYLYDKVGNRIRFNNSFEASLKDNFIIDTRSDQLMKRQFSRSHINFSYDAMGHLIQKKMYSTVMTAPVKTIDYHYNYQGMLSQVNENSNCIAQYAYDTQKQRIFSIIKGNKRIYHWDLSGNIIGESTSDKDFVIRYINMGFQKMAMIRSDQSENEEIFYFVNTPQGTPVLILDDKGNIVQRMQMDAFGNVERIVSIFKDATYYTGKKYDAETGLYYFHHRYYDPELGRFISHDPAMQFLNPYTYAENNPLRYVDPDGEFIQVVLIGMIVGYASHGFSTGDWTSKEAFLSAAIGGVAGLAGWAAGGYAIGIQGSELIAQIGYGMSSGAAYGATQSGLKYIAHTDHFNFNDFISNTARGAVIGGATGGLTAGGLHLISNFFKDTLQEQIQVDIGNMKISTKKMLSKYVEGAKNVTVDEVMHFLGHKGIGKLTFDQTYQELLQQWGYYAITQVILNEDGRKAMDRHFRNHPIKVRYEHKF